MSQHGETRPAAARWVRLCATWFGCGHLKPAPGTWGSLGALPLFVLLSFSPLPLYALGTALVTVLGVISAGSYARALGSDDPSQVVIDEVAGVLIALGVVHAAAVLAAASLAPQHAANLWHLGFAWVLFRAFDIFKPWPISAAEHAKPLGLGIMADDLVAGLLAGLITVAIF